MLNLLLIIIAALLFLIYRKVNKFIEGSHSEEKDVYSVKDWLQGISRNLNDVIKNTSAIADHFLADSPAGNKSDRYRKMNNLIKIYAQHLVGTKKLSEKDALIRARFELHEFGEDKVIDQIDDDLFGGLYWRERRKAEADYYASGILDKDIREVTNYVEGHEKKPAPYYLAAPIYDVLIKQHYEREKAIEKSWFRDENSYHDFVEGRAIIYHLEKLGIIKKANNEGWGGKQKWTIPNVNWSKIKEEIYEGGTSHDDGYFEEQYKEGKLDHLFQVTDLK